MESEDRLFSLGFGLLVGGLGVTFTAVHTVGVIGGLVMTAIGLAVLAAIAKKDSRKKGGRGRQAPRPWRAIVTWGVLLGIAIAAAGFYISHRPTGIFGTLDNVQFMTEGDCQAEFTKRGAGVLVVAAIGHSGGSPPSAVYDYGLTTVSPDGEQEIAWRLEPMPSNLGVLRGHNMAHVYTPADALYRKTETPLHVGDRRSGALLFRTDQAAPFELTRTGTRYILTFKDVAGRTLTAEHRWPPYATSCDEIPMIEWPR